LKEKRVEGETVIISRIWCDAESEVELAPQSGAAGLTFSVVDAEGTALTLSEAKAKTGARGWYTLKVSSVAQGNIPFTLSVTWTSTQSL